MLKLLWKLLASGTGKRELLDAMLREHDAKLRFVPDVVEAPSNASQRNSFTSAVPEEEMALSNLSFAQRRQLMPTMIQLMWQMNRSADFYVRPMRAPRTYTPPGLLDELEVSAREAGATQVS